MFFLHISLPPFFVDWTFLGTKLTFTWARDGVRPAKLVEGQWANKGNLADDCLVGAQQISNISLVRLRGITRQEGGAQRSRVKLDGLCICGSTLGNSGSTLGNSLWMSVILSGFVGTWSCYSQDVSFTATTPPSSQDCFLKDFTFFIGLSKVRLWLSLGDWRSCPVALLLPAAGKKLSMSRKSFGRTLSTNIEP